MSDSPDSPLVSGDLLLDRYRVSHKIAVGGHSLIFYGVDERLSRPVCLKVFHKLASEFGIWKTSYEHFVQEAFALSRLSHPNTLRIYDFGHIAGDDEDTRIPVQVSEFMEGGTLSELVRRQGLVSVKETVSITAKLADALAEAHEHGIVHRDIKPQNILFSSGGAKREPKLADFGIAKASALGRLSNQANDTKIVAGYPLAMYSPSWAAPEQMAGVAATAATDIYSLALVAIYMMTGTVVFAAANTMDGYNKRKEYEALVRAALDRISLPEATRELLVQATAYEMSERPRDAGEFGAVLRATLEHISSPAEPTPAPSVASVQPTLVSIDGQRHLSGASPLRLSPSQEAQPVGLRTCNFVEVDAAATLDLGKARVQVTMLPIGPHQRSLHVKGLNAFVAKVGGRPSAGLQVQEDSEIDLVDLRNQHLVRLRLSFGQPAAGHTVFQLDQESVALDLGECPLPVLVDSPAQAQSFFVHGPPSSGERPMWRRRR